STPVDQPRRRRYVIGGLAVLIGILTIALALVLVDRSWIRQPSDQGDPAHGVGVGTTLHLPPARGADIGGDVLPGVNGPTVMISSVGLVAGLDPISFVGNVLSPPPDVRRAGIWSAGASLEVGGLMPTVIAGHVSDDNDNPGEFRKLWRVRSGMIAVTRDDAGHLRRWRAVLEQVFAKDALPRSLFLPGNRRVLRLITCAARESLSGGHFHYQDNLVVTFIPVA
ncbi:MAG TPA: class F sortase, partial [Marmoricola sp.]|nr:class F sortase [Marmoricola sp.]